MYWDLAVLQVLKSLFSGISTMSLLLKPKALTLKIELASQSRIWTIAAWW